MNGSIFLPCLNISLFMLHFLLVRCLFLGRNTWTLLNLADHPGRPCQIRRSHYGGGEWPCEGDSESKPAHGKKLTSNRLISCSLMLSPHSHQARTEMPAIRTIFHPREPSVPTRAVVRDDVARSPQDAVMRAECPAWLPALPSRSVHKAGSP